MTADEDSGVLVFGVKRKANAPPNPAPLAPAGVRGELRINATRWQTNENENTNEPAELQL